MRQSDRTCSIRPSWQAAVALIAECCTEEAMHILRTIGYAVYRSCDPGNSSALPFLYDQRWSHNVECSDNSVGIQLPLYTITIQTYPSHA